MDSRSGICIIEINIDEMCDNEELYRRGEEYLREVFRRENNVKYEIGKRIIEGVKREFGERCLNVLTELKVDYGFLEEKGEAAKARMRELFRPLSDIKIAGRYFFKEVAENIDKIESWDNEMIEVDYEYKYNELKKEIETIQRENNAVQLIGKKYDLIEVEKEEKTSKEEAKGIIERYCDDERERKECQRILDGIEEGSIKIEDRRYYCSDYNYTEKTSYDPLLKAIKKAIEANDWRAVAFLSRGCYLASLNSINYKYTLFGYSCMVNSIDCAVYLLKKGGGIEQRFESGVTPLSESSRVGNKNVSRFLIERGANIEAKDDEDRRTPLHWAVLNKRFEVVKLLIERGANIEAKDMDGRTPLHWAASNNIEVVKLLIERGANIEAKDLIGATPIHFAAYNNNIEAIKLLIEKGANIKEETNMRETPLNFAVENKSNEAAKLLIERGVKINKPLDFAPIYKQK